VVGSGCEAGADRGGARDGGGGGERVDENSKNGTGGVEVNGTGGSEVTVEVEVTVTLSVCEVYNEV
jgi:hypothetical protein